MNRRKFVAGLAAAAGVPALALAEPLVDSLGRPLVNSNRVPAQHTVFGGGAGPLNVQFSIKNNSASTIANPQVTLGHEIAPGDVPTGYRLALYDSTGTTQITNFQQDQESTWRFDGSLKFAALSFVSPDTFTAGQLITYTLKAVSGAANKTPNVTLAQMQAAMAANDISWNFTGLSFGTDLFKCSAHDVLTNFASAPFAPTITMSSSTTSGNVLNFASTTGVSIGDMAVATNIPANTFVTAVTATTVTLGANVSGTVSGVVSFQYPRGGYEIIRSGPVCTEFLCWQYIKRVSDGAMDGWHQAKLWIRMWGTSGPIEVVTRLLRPNSYGAMPGSTVGTNVATKFNTTLTYGGSTAATWGGAGDPNSFTLAPSAFNVSTGRVTLPSGFTNAIYQGGLGVTMTSTGTLPAGLAANTVYFPTPAGSGWLLLIYRFYVAQLATGGYPEFTTWTANTAVGPCFLVKSGFIYIATSGGTTGNAGGPTGAVGQSDGTVFWNFGGWAFTDQGTGTHTVNPALCSFQHGGFVGAQTDCSRVWIAAGSGAVQPKLLLQKDFTYVTTRSRAVPCYDPAAGSTLTFMTGPAFPYIQNVPVMDTSGSKFNLSNVGENNYDERIGYLNCSSAALLFNQLDPLNDQFYRNLALSWADSIYNNSGDERSAGMVISNWGHNHTLAQYANCAPGNYLIQYITIQPAGSPVWIGNPPGWDNDAGYGYDYAVMADGSHMPILSYLPYLRTGDPVYFDLLRSQVNASLGSLNNSNGDEARNLDTGTVTNPITGDTKYAGVITAKDQQARGMGWATRALGRCLHVMPDSDPHKPYLYDCIDESAAYAASWQSYLPAQETQMGWIPVQMPAGYNNQAIEPWMHSIYTLAFAMEAWAGEQALWKTGALPYVEKQFAQVLDTAQGGCDGNADAQWMQVSTAGGPGSAFDASFLTSAQTILADTYYNQSPPWDASTCSSHTGLLNGLNSQGNNHFWVASISPLSPCQYFMMCRSAQSMAAVAGRTLPATLVSRIETRMAQVGPVQYNIAHGQYTQPNFVHWAIRIPASHS